MKISRLESHVARKIPLMRCSMLQARKLNPKLKHWCGIAAIFGL